MNILRIIKKTNLQPKLGRWGVTYEEKILDKRINWANHDHCGSEVCEKLLEKKSEKKSEKKEKKEEKDVDYYLPYCL
jgi:hypothetical protein